MEETSIFLKYIADRVNKKNLSFYGVTVGAVGSGKSYHQLEMARRLGLLTKKPFTLDNLYFKPLNMLRDFNQGKIPPGTVVILEETGVSLDSKRFQTNLNRSLGYIFQTMRSRNNIILLNLPSFALLDKTIRHLVQCIMAMKNVNRVKKISKSNPLLLQTNELSGKLYFHHLHDRNGDPITRFETNLPPLDLVNAYEKKKLLFQKALYKEIENSLMVSESKESVKQFNPALLTTKQQGVLDIINEGGYVDEIAKKFSISKAGAYGHLTAIRAKGVKIPYK